MQPVRPHHQVEPARCGVLKRNVDSGVIFLQGCHRVPEHELGAVPGSLAQDGCRVSPRDFDVIAA